MKKNRFTTTQLAIAGLMIAITVILSYQNIYLFPPRSGRITLRFIPMIFSGILLGPTLGTIIGGASDPLIYFMTLGSPGMYFPGYMLTNMVIGFFPGLIIGKNIEKESKFSLIGCSSCCQGFKIFFNFKSFAYISSFFCCYNIFRQLLAIHYKR